MKLKVTKTVSRLGVTQKVVQVIRVSPFGIPAGILTTDFTQKGGILVGTGNNAHIEKPPGSDGQVIVYDANSPGGIKASTLTVGLPPGFIFGLNLSNGTDAVNDINIATGKCRNGADTDDMLSTPILTKQLDAAWVVGTNAGGLDTGSIGNNTYHIWLIKRTDTGVVDALFSLSATTPTMPANYDQKRRIGSIVRAAATIKAFIQDDDSFYWLLPVADVLVTNPGISAVTRTMTLPTGIRVKGIFSVVGKATSVAADNPQGVYVSDLLTTDTAANETAQSVYVYSGAANPTELGATVMVWTNTSAQVRSRVTVSTAGTVLYMGTLGWIDTRGK